MTSNRFNRVRSQSLAISRFLLFTCLPFSPIWARGLQIATSASAHVAASQDATGLGLFAETNEAGVSPSPSNQTAALIMVAQKGKYGFIDNTGRIVIPFRYSAADSFSEGLANVKVGQKWGYIDEIGKMVIAPLYSFAFPFYEGLAAVEIGKKWGFIDKTGQVTIPAVYEFVPNFSDGLATVEIPSVDRSHPSSDWGYVDKTGRMVLAPQRRTPANFSNGLAGSRSMANGRDISTTPARSSYLRSLVLSSSSTKDWPPLDLVANAATSTKLRTSSYHLSTKATLSSRKASQRLRLRVGGALSTRPVR